MTSQTFDVHSHDLDSSECPRITDRELVTRELPAFDSRFYPECVLDAICSKYGLNRRAIRHWRMEYLPHKATYYLTEMSMEIM